MRLWSLHPKYLDAKGIVALWREGLLAKNVLEGKTKGYKFHPQLDRFKAEEDPVKAIHEYLFCVMTEATARNYNFDQSKINAKNYNRSMTVTKGQILYEWKHLLNKLEKRDPNRFEAFKSLPPEKIISHPMFTIIDGDIEEWEIV